MKTTVTITQNEISDWPLDGVEAVDACPLCGSHHRTLLHHGLTDRLFGAPGSWSLHRCIDCGLGYLAPRPTRETIGLAYANYSTHTPAVKPRKSGVLGTLRECIRNGYLNRRYGYKLQPAPAWGYWVMYLLPAPIRWEQDQHARHLPPPRSPREQLLDIGCGNGEFLINARAAGWTGVGLEPDEQAASIGRKHGLEIHCTTYDRADLPPESFDVITSNQVIEHVHDPHAFVARIHQWLKPGGTVWIGTPNLDSLMHAHFGINYGNLHPPQHLLMFSPSTLRRLFEHHGFTSIEFHKRGFHDYSQALGSAALMRGETGPSVYLGVKHAPFRDKIRGMYFELAAWRDFRACSDLVMLATKASS